MPHDNEEPADPSHNAAENLSWEEIMKARADEALQDWGWKHWPPEDISAAAGCRKCRRLPTDLAWIFYRNGSKGAAADRGVEGWIVACPHCRTQTDFLPTLMS